MSDEPCPHERCGRVVTIGRYPNGWVRLDVAGSGQEHRRYCSIACLARANPTAAPLTVLPSPFRRPASLADVAVALALLSCAGRRYVNLMSATEARIEALWAAACEHSTPRDLPLLADARALALEWARRPYLADSPVDDDETVIPEEIVQWMTPAPRQQTA